MSQHEVALGIHEDYLSDKEEWQACKKHNRLVLLLTFRQYFNVSDNDIEQLLHGSDCDDIVVHVLQWVELKLCINGLTMVIFHLWNTICHNKSHCQSMCYCE